MNAIYKKIFIFLSLLFGTQLTAKPNISAPLEKIIVLEQGRLKPLQTYAKNILLQFSGKSRYKKETATEWMARLLFDPQTTFHDDVFLINNPQVADALDIPRNPHRLYSYFSLQKNSEKLLNLASTVSKIDDKERSPVDRALLSTFGNMRLFVALSQSFLFFQPHDNFTVTNEGVKKLLKLKAEQTKFSFADVYQHVNLINAHTQILLKKDQSKWSQLEKELFTLAKGLYSWSKMSGFQPFTFIPISVHGKNDWISAYDAFITGNKDAVVAQLMGQLKIVYQAYHDKKAQQIQQAASIFIQSVNNHIQGQNMERPHIWLETTYNKLDLFYHAEILYGLGFILMLFFLISYNQTLYKIATASTFIAVLLQGAGSVARMIIMSRPPITNLFETFIFVGFTCVLIALFLEYMQRSGLGLLSANFCGLAMLLISGKFGSDGDTMKMLVAVLDSNFWLATHVITISMGYAGCCIAGVIGHIYVLQRLFNKEPARLAATYRAIYGTIAFGLIFSFIGTVLGGIWADQSWGRFWGWDPKENGALLIVLWCGILLHAKRGKLVDAMGFAYGSIFGVVVVMMAWFGINLLGVGLHAYGFTSGIASGLLMYTLFEFFFVIITYGFSRVSNKSSGSPVSPSSAQA